jgi:uncharacterized BrkB/YihY/UPF0761 family membrane protein
VTIPAGFGLWFLLLILVSVMIPNRSTVSLGYDASGLPLEPVASSRLLILPVIAIFLYTICLIVGAYYYRKEATRPVSHMLWVGGIIPSFLFLITALFFIN